MARTRDLWKNPARQGRGRRWLAVWTAPDGREQSRAFAKKADAERHGTTMEASRHRGAYIDPRLGTQTVREYAQQWLPRRLDLKPGTVIAYDSHLRNHVYPLLGERRIGGVRRADIKHFVGAVAAKDLAPSTVKTIYAVLQALFAGAADDEVIAVSPCVKITLPKVPRELVEPLPAAAVLALFDAIGPRWRAAVALGAGAGLREGEALGLTVARTDFLRRKINVRQQVQRGGLVSPKSEKSSRTVPADDWVLEALTAHLAAFGQGPEGVIMTSPGGKLAAVSTFTDAWRAAVAAAGLPKGTRFHDLRHFYASTLIAANINPKVIQARLGHHSISETMDTYGHLFPESEELGRGAVDRALSGVAAEQGRNREHLATVPAQVTNL